MDNNVSRFGIEVGTFEEDENCPKLHLCVDINTDIANECQETLLGAGLTKAFTEFSVVVAINAVAGKEEQLKQTLDTIFNDANFEGKMFRFMREDILRKNLKEGQPSLSYESSSNDGKVFCSFKIPAQIANKEKLEQFQGLEGIAQNQTNQLELTALLGNNFETLMGLNANGYNYLNALLNKASLQFDISLNPGLPDKLKEVFSPILQMMRIPVDMVFGLVKVYQKLDLNFQFNSTEQLPEKVKKTVGRELNDIGKAFKPYGGWKEEDMKCWESLGETINGSGDVYFLVPGFARAHASFRAPKFNKWFSGVVKSHQE